MSLVFSRTDADMMTCFMEGKTFYVHLVTADPAIGDRIVGDLVLPVGGNYTAYELQVSIIEDGAGVRLIANNSPVWIGLSTDDAAPILGAVICYRSGASFSNSDPVVSYRKLVDAAGQPAPHTPNGEDFTGIDLSELLSTRTS